MNRYTERAVLPNMAEEIIQQILENDKFVYSAGHGRFGRALPEGNTHFILSMTGMLSLHTSGQRFQLPQGQFCILNSAAATIYAARDGQWIFFSLPRENLCKLVNAHGDEEVVFTQTIEDTPEPFKRTALQLCSIDNEPADAEKHNFANFALHLIDWALASDQLRIARCPGRNLSAKQGNYRRLLKARFKMQTEVTEQYTLKRYADCANYSEWHFVRTFHEVFNETPLGVIGAQKLRVAKFLLQNAELSVNEIAREVGYQTISSFCRFFRTETGLTASAHMQKMSAANNLGPNRKKGKRTAQKPEIVNPA